MSDQDLLTLRGQFQDAVLAHIGFYWSGVKMLLGLIFALFSIQSGLMAFTILQNASPTKLNCVLLIIPVSIVMLCIVGIKNAGRESRNVLEYIACLAKIEEKIDFSRDQKSDRKYFVCDDSILCDRWIQDREKYKTTQEFKDGLLKINTGTIFGIINIVYIILILIASALIVYVILL